MCRDLFPGNLWRQLLIHRVNVWGNYQGVCPDSLAGLQVSVSSGYDKVTITDLRDPVFYGTQGSFLLLNFVVVNLGDTVGLTGAPLFK